MPVDIEEQIQMKKEELKKQFVSIYVGFLQGIGIIAYTWLKKDELISGIDWFFAFVFALVSLSGTFIFTSFYNLWIMMKQASMKQIREERIKRKNDSRISNSRRYRSHRGYIDDDYEEIPPPEDYYEEDYDPYHRRRSYRNDRRTQRKYNNNETKREQRRNEVKNEEEHISPRREEEHTIEDDII